MNRKLTLIICFFSFILVNQNISAQYYQSSIFDSVIVTPKNPVVGDVPKLLNYTTHFRSGCYLDSSDLHFVGADLLKLHLYFSTDNNPMNCSRVDTIGLLPFLADSFDVIVDLTTYSSIDTIVDTLYMSFVVYEADVGLKDESKFSSLILYPNPANNLLNFTLTDNSNSITLAIIDVTGKSIKTVQYSNQESGAFNNSVDISALKNGLYFCKFSNGKKQVTRKFIKNKSL